MELLSVRTFGEFQYHPALARLVRLVYFTKTFDFDLCIRSQDLRSSPIIFTAKLKERSLALTYIQNEPVRLWEDHLRCSLCLPLQTSSKGHRIQPAVPLESELTHTPKPDTNWLSYTIWF